MWRHSKSSSSGLLAACLYSVLLAGGGGRLYCVPPSSGGNPPPCLDTRPPCHPAVTFADLVVGVALEPVVKADLVVGVALEPEVEAGVTVEVKAVVVVLILGAGGQQIWSLQGLLSSSQFIELQNSS